MQILQSGIKYVIWQILRGGNVVETFLTVEWQGALQAHPVSRNPAEEREDAADWMHPPPNCEKTQRINILESIFSPISKGGTFETFFL